MAVTGFLNVDFLILIFQKSWSIKKKKKKKIAHVLTYKHIPKNFTSCANTHKWLSKCNGPL